MEARRREPYEEDRITGRTDITRTDLDRGEPRLVDRTDVITSDVLRERDGVRWGPIWGGALAAFGILALLGALGAAIGLTANATAGAAVDPTMATVWGAIIVAIALFVGGYIAGRFASIGGAISGLAHSFLTWATLLALGVVLAGFGFASGLAMMGGPGGLGGPAGGAAPFTPGDTGATWGPFAIMLIGLLASLIGGYLGGTQLRGRPDFRL